MDRFFIYMFFVSFTFNIIAFSTNTNLNKQITRLWKRVESMAGIIVEREREIADLKSEIEIRKELTYGEDNND